MNIADIQYLELLQKIIHNGTKKEDRTNTGTLSIFGEQLRFDLSTGRFPLLTTKKLHLRSIIHELLWFISGETNIEYLKDNSVRIWDEWVDSDGNLGPVYGHQWRNFNSSGFDQIANVVEQLKTNPNSRRLLVSAWNPEQLSDMALPPCHYSFQFYANNGKLSLLFNMRSSDVFLGLPFNIASYSLLLMMVAQQVNMEPYELVANLGDTHLYLNHLQYAEKQLRREIIHQSPIMNIKKANDIFSYKYDDFELTDYKSYKNWKNVPIAV